MTFIGGGRGPVMSNRTAINQSIQVRRRNAQVVLQNNRMMQQNLLLSRQQATELVDEIANTEATAADLRAFREWLEQVRADEFDPDAVPPEVQSNPYAWLLRLLPDSKGDWYQFLSLIVSIIALVYTLVAANEPQDQPVTINIEQKQTIVNHIEIQVEPPTDAPG